MNRGRGLVSAAALSMLAACASVPSGPTVPVLPGTGKSFEQFHADDGACQQFASTQITRDASSAPSYVTQRKYDLNYIQCMYAKGHRVPVLGPMAVRPAQAPGPVMPSPPPSGQPGAPAPSSTPR